MDDVLPPRFRWMLVLCYPWKPRRLSRLPVNPSCNPDSLSQNSIFKLDTRFTRSTSFVLSSCSCSAAVRYRALFKLQSASLRCLCLLFATRFAERQRPRRRHHSSIRARLRSWKPSTPSTTDRTNRRSKIMLQDLPAL